MLLKENSENVYFEALLDFEGICRSSQVCWDLSLAAKP